jgi:hypothetical protein
MPLAFTFMKQPVPAMSFYGARKAGREAYGVE